MSRGLVQDLFQAGDPVLQIVSQVGAGHLALQFLLQREIGCIIGRDYPAPIVEYAMARQRALQAHRIKEYE